MQTLIWIKTINVGGWWGGGEGYYTTRDKDICFERQEKKLHLKQENKFKNMLDITICTSFPSPPGSVHRLQDYETNVEDLNL